MTSQNFETTVVFSGEKADDECSKVTDKEAFFVAAL